MSWTSTDEKTFAVEERGRVPHREQHSQMFRSIRATVCLWSYECAIYNQCVESMQEMERNETESWQGLILQSLCCQLRNVSFVRGVVAELKSFSLG